MDQYERPVPVGPLSNLWLANSEADIPIARELKERIRVEQVALLYRNSTTGFMVSIAAGALLVFALSAHIPFERLVIWYGLLLVVTVARYSLIRFYENSAPDKQQSRNWEILFLLGTGAAGLVWGLSIIMLFPADSVAYQFLIALVLSGMAGGAVAVFSARKTVYLAFCFYHPDSCHPALSV